MGVSHDHVTWGFPSLCNMDLIEVEAFSFLRQEITQRIIVESNTEN